MRALLTMISIFHYTLDADPAVHRGRFQYQDKRKAGIPVPGKSIRESLEAVPAA